MQIEFGSAVNTSLDDVNLLSDGSLVFNRTGLYRLKITVTFGRTGSGGVSKLRFRALVNGVQAGLSIGADVDNANGEFPYSDEAWLNISEGTTVTYEVMRDADGNNSGGLYKPLISDVEWNTATCASIRVEKYI